jgi:hypothetical protein
MKTFIWFTLCLAISFQSTAQHQLYTSDNDKRKFDKLSSILTFVDDKNALESTHDESKFGAAGIIAIVSATVQFGAALSSKITEKKKEQYKTQHIITGVNADPGPALTSIPKIEVRRYGDGSTPLYQFDLIPKSIELGTKDKDNPVPYFFYELSNFDFNYSEARINNSKPYVDFTIELQVRVTDENNKQAVYKSSPITLYYARTDDKTKPDEGNILGPLIPRNVAVLDAHLTVHQTNSYAIPHGVFVSSLVSSAPDLAGLFNAIGKTIPEKDETSNQ